MIKHRRAAALGAVAALVLLAAGCGAVDRATTPDTNDPASPDTKPAGWFTVVTVTVNGRQVPCVTWADGYRGGISCDWSASR